MPLSQPTVSPAALATARLTVDVTHKSTCNPAIIGGAWDVMKSARGQRCNFAVLAQPAHLILSTPAPAAPPAPADLADLDQVRIAARIRRHMAIKGYDHSGGGGDAA